MIPHPPELDAAYGKAVVTPWARVTITDPISGRSTAVVPIEGQLVQDRTIWPRTELVFTIPTALTPPLTAAPANPFGGTVALDLGAYVAGQLYTYRAAILDVDYVELERPAGTYTVHAVSREAKVNEHRLNTPVTLGASQSISSYISGLIDTALGAAYPRSLTVTDRSTATSDELTIDGGRWDSIETLADALDAEPYFDPASRAFMLTAQPRRGTPVLRLFTGRTGPGATLLGYRWRQQWAPNRVTVRQRAQDTGYYTYGQWEDTDAASVTRTTGPYGVHAVNLDARDAKTAANMAGSDKLAQRAAARARRERMSFRSMTLRALPAGWLTPGDTVRISLLDGKTFDLMVNRIETPLSGTEAQVLVCEDDDVTSSPT